MLNITLICACWAFENQLSIWKPILLIVLRGLTKRTICLSTYFLKLTANKQTKKRMKKYYSYNVYSRKKARNDLLIQFSTLTRLFLSSRGILNQQNHWTMKQRGPWQAPLSPLYLPIFIYLQWFPWRQLLVLPASDPFWPLRVTFGLRGHGQGQEVRSGQRAMEALLWLALLPAHIFSFWGLSTGLVPQ